MKYAVIYTCFDTTYQAHFDELDDAKFFALMKDLEVDCRNANLIENLEGEFDPKTGYFSGTCRFIEFKNK
ncbi:MAG: hypothetical protein EBZ49_04915 [Proteobacteria bacterium]|nr:hypothetical protein [Pseudomonadota bacterium]